MLIDTHCHIHDDNDFRLNITETLEHAHQSGVEKMITIGTNISDSKKALEFASGHKGVFASAGVHPEYITKDLTELESLVADKNSKLVAIGEIGLDYYGNHAPREDQIEMFQAQIELALKHNLPIIFHVREAYEDFWPVVDNFRGLRGVLHCFTDTIDNAKKGLERGFYISINGIITFTRDETQKEMFNSLPLDRIVLETDAPFLTPTPFRGKINEPAFVKNVAEYYGVARQISFDEIAQTTTANALKLFGLND